MTNRSMSATGSPWRHWPSHFPHMLQYAGRMISLVTASSFWSSGPNGCDMALMFSSNWSMSVMLGTVVWTLGLRTTHLSAASMAPSRLSFSCTTLPGCGRRNPPAMIFIATTPLPALAAASITSFMNGSMEKLYCVRMTSTFGLVVRKGISSFCPLCVLTPAKRILPAFLAICWASMRPSVTSSGLVLACRYQMSTKSVPSVWRLVSSCASASSLVWPSVLVERTTSLRFFLSAYAHHALVVAALVVARGIEIGDPQVGGAFHDAAIRRDHAAESDCVHFQTGFPEVLV